MLVWIAFFVFIDDSKYQRKHSEADFLLSEVQIAWFLRSSPSFVNFRIKHNLQCGKIGSI